jgi:tetratricopeptide (TPR) repeat protein
MSLALLLSTYLAVVPSSPTDSVRALERLCNRAVEDGRTEAADALAARLDAASTATAAYIKGCQYLVQRDFGRAGAEFERAVKAEPSNAVYHFWFGRATGEQAQRANVLRKPGLARRTRAEFERALELDSTYVAAREGLLRYYLAAPGVFGGSVERAREQALAIARLNPYRGGLAHASVAQAVKDTAALIRAHEELAVQFPDSATPWLVLANVHAVRRDWPATWAAVDALERADPGRPLAQYAIGRTAAESGEQLDRGEAALRAYLALAPGPAEPSPAAAHWRLGLIAEKRGDGDEARRAYEAALQVDPTFSQARAGLARVRR